MSGKWKVERKFCLCVCVCVVAKSERENKEKGAKKERRDRELILNFFHLQRTLVVFFVSVPALGL